MTAADLLFETADPSRDPEGLITNFLRYEAFRIHRQTYEDDMIGRLPDRMNVLFWYLSDYIKDRNYQYSVPLSAKQAEFLNSPAPIAGVSAAVTVALHNFVLRERPTLANLADPAILRQAVYWWCVEKTPLLKLTDRLVTDEQVALLRTEVEWIGEEFALNAFMTCHFKRHAELHVLDMNLARDRAAFFYYLVLQAFSNPPLLKLLPRDALRRILREEKGAPSAFDRVIARFCLKGVQRDDLDAARQLRRLGEAVLLHDGLRLDRDAPRRTSRVNTGECLRPRPDLMGPPEPGVAVIGPARKASGLGQAMRLSVDILTRCETIAPTVRDFDLDNPAPVGFASQTDFTPYTARRAINLIHLNADFIPLVYAFEPEAMFRDSYNIGYFFWELNMIPKCQYLGLELLDEIWVSSEYNREIYARFTGKPVINVGMAVEPLPQVEPMPRAELELDEDCFVFLTTFDSFSFIERKNPLGVIEAFCKAFPLGTEKARLILKTQNRFRVSDAYQVKTWKRIDAAVQRDPRVVVINETFAYRDLLGLKRACDCYVSLHRSEGWGFGVLEAMQLGMPVIATAFSGNMDFCTPDTSYLVDYAMVGVREEEYIFVERGSQWAQPDLDHATSLMRTAFADPAAAKVKGEAAATHIKANFSIEAIARRYASRLAEIRAR